ncbi:unnamed protein product, partial [Mesorhabditis spiculigera]
MKHNKLSSCFVPGSVNSHAQPFRQPLSCIGKVTPLDGQISFERFLSAVKLSLRDQEINNNNNGSMSNLYRVQSEGRLAQGTHQPKRSPPTMGVNGLDQRRVIYASNPNLRSSPNYENMLYGQVQMRPKKTTVRAQKRSIVFGIPCHRLVSKKLACRADDQCLRIVIIVLRLLAWKISCGGIQ